MSFSDLARLMFLKVAPRQQPNKSRIEPGKLRFETLEDRNAPGSLLGELLAAARGEGAPNPLDQLTWLFPSSSQRPVAETRAAAPTIRISTAISPAPTAGAPFELVGPSAGSGNSTTAGYAIPSVNIRSSVRDEDLLFASAAHPAYSPSAAVAGASGMASSGGDGSTAPVLPRSNGGSNAGGSAAPEPSGSGASFYLRSSTLRPPKPAATSTTEADTSGAVTTTVTVSHELEAELPPNTAPVANNDTASVNEDSFVVIDVLGNDTDANAGDVLRLDTWTVEAGNGVVTQQVAGKLTYTPFPNFYGTDTFTYNITDGRDTSMMSATVTVTVNSVNDAPVVFNDAAGFMHGNMPTDPPTMLFGTGKVLGNDIDYDGGGLVSLTVAEVDTTGTVGSIVWNTTPGEFTWSGPKSFFGTTDFRYKVADANNALSDWATVHLWANKSSSPPMSPPPMSPPPITPPPPISPPPVANADTIPFGDQPVTANVLTNDSGGSVAVPVAVLQGHPPSGRVTAFRFDGTVTYAPGTRRVDESFSYRLYSLDGMVYTSATVQTVKVNLEIYNGQGGTAVSDVDMFESKIGAFTVVNKNDTDGDAIVDNIDKMGVRATDGKGKDEVDLMRLVVYKPAGWAAGDQAFVTVKEGSARLFIDSLRTGDGASKFLVDHFNDPGAPNFRTFWAEIYESSNMLRAVSIELEYKGVTDTVKATGVWVDFAGATAFHANGQKGHAPDADDPTYTKIFDMWTNKVNGFQLGQSPMMTSPFDPRNGNVGFTVSLRNAMEMEFIVRPALVEKEPGVRIDITRTVESAGWTYKPDGKGGLTVEGGVIKAFPLSGFREEANDDLLNSDEDNYPKNQHIYSWDIPGVSLPITPAALAAGDISGGFVRILQHMNAQEFVRVSVNGAKLGGNVYQPSRASELVDWRSWMDYLWDANTKTWVRPVDTPQDLYNELALVPTGAKQRVLGTTTRP